MESPVEQRKRLLQEVSTRLSDIVNLIYETGIDPYLDVTETHGVVIYNDTEDVPLYSVVDSLHSDILTELEGMDDEST